MSEASQGCKDEERKRHSMDFKHFQKKNTCSSLFFLFLLRFGFTIINRLWLKHRVDTAWFPASTRPRSFEGTGCKGSDLLTPGQKPAKPQGAPLKSSENHSFCWQARFKACHDDNRSPDHCYGAWLRFLSRRYFRPLRWSPVPQSEMTSGNQTGVDIHDQTLDG